MGKKDPCAVFGCNIDRLFPEKYTVEDHISNTKLEKGPFIQRIRSVKHFERKCRTGLKFDLELKAS